MAGRTTKKVATRKGKMTHAQKGAAGLARALGLGGVQRKINKRKRRIMSQ